MPKTWATKEQMKSARKMYEGKYRSKFLINGRVLHEEEVAAELRLVLQETEHFYTFIDPLTREICRAENWIN